MSLELRDDSDGYIRSGNILLENRPMSNLEKLHFIIGHGILRPDIRYAAVVDLRHGFTQQLNVVAMKLHGSSVSIVYFHFGHIRVKNHFRGSGKSHLSGCRALRLSVTEQLNKLL